MEHESKKRAALGAYVWRAMDGSDAFWNDCIGPSGYSKGQGTPIKVWGMLACGILHVHVLDEGESMDTMTYVELIEDKFEEWCGNCTHLVCDFEGCLRSEEAVNALQRVGLKLVDRYPRCSQDFNAIENAWLILKDRLDETIPVRLETRDAFIARLHSAVQWANRHRAEQLWYYSTNQKERAHDSLMTKPPGGRTKW